LAIGSTTGEFVSRLLWRSSGRFVFAGAFQGGHKIGHKCTSRLARWSGPGKAEAPLQHICWHYPVCHVILNPYPYSSISTSLSGWFFMALPAIALQSLSGSTSKSAPAQHHWLSASSERLEQVAPMTEDFPRACPSQFHPNIVANAGLMIRGTGVLASEPSKSSPDSASHLPCVESGSQAVQSGRQSQ
jgi:hypothetical protein